MCCFRKLDLSKADERTSCRELLASDVINFAHNE